MIVDLFILFMLIGLFIAVYATMTLKGYSVGWALLATAISILVSPLVVLLICLFILPETKDSTMNDEEK